MRRGVFQAIADPTTAISKHIRILTECGLVTIRQQGRERFCSGELGKLGEVAEWLKPYQAFWNQKLDAPGHFLHTPTVKKDKIEKVRKLLFSGHNFFPYSHG